MMSRAWTPLHPTSPHLRPECTDAKKACQVKTRDFPLKIPFLGSRRPVGPQPRLSHPGWWSPPLLAPRPGPGRRGRGTGDHVLGDRVDMARLDSIDALAHGLGRRG